MSNPICYECLKLMVKKHSIIYINRPGFGEYKVPGVLHFSCEKCGTKIIPPIESLRITQKGIKLHLLKVLKELNTESVLNLCQILKCELSELNEVLIQLNDENIISLSDTGRFPMVSLNTIEPKIKKGFISKLINSLFKGEASDI